MGSGSTIEFLGVWEKVHNPDFNVVQFHHIKTEFTRNTFLMSVSKWIENTGTSKLEFLVIVDPPWTSQDESVYE